MFLPPDAENPAQGRPRRRLGRRDPGARPPRDLRVRPARTGHRHPAGAQPRAAAPVQRPVPARHRGRVPGHQPGPVARHPGPGRGQHRHLPRRPRPADLRGLHPWRRRGPPAAGHRRPQPRRASTWPATTTAAPGNGILDYANAVLRGRPASLPEAVYEVRYRYPSTAGAARPQADPASSRPHLAGQLGRLPTIAVLAPLQRVRRGHLRGHLRRTASTGRDDAARGRPRAGLGPRPVSRRRVRRRQHPRMARAAARRGDHRDAAQASRTSTGSSSPPGNPLAPGRSSPPPRTRSRRS